MHSFCKLQVAHLRVTKNLMMKTLPDMGSPSYLFSTARWAEDFFLYFILVFCDAYRWISVWRYFNTSSDASNAFCWFLFPGPYWWFLVERNVGRSAYWSIEYIKEIPISTQKKKRFYSRGQQQRKFTGKKNRSYIRKRFNSYWTGLEQPTTWPPFYCFGTVVTRMDTVKFRK